MQKVLDKIYSNLLVIWTISILVLKVLGVTEISWWAVILPALIAYILSLAAAVVLAGLVATAIDSLEINSDDVEQFMKLFEELEGGNE